MIAATCEAFQNIGLQLNPMILPLHGSTWGHNSLPMPWSKGDKISMVDFIRLPGTDELDDVSLLAYPLLLHEIGHNILFRYGAAFSDRFRADLETITNRFRLSSIADRGRARSNYQNRIEMIRRYWTPSPNHKNWASESAIDVIAFWVCGPAYLAALCDEMDQRHVQPYFLEQEHPPNYVRMSALRCVAVKLGWMKHLSAVDHLLDRWKRASPGPTSRYNEYVALTDPQIIDACLATSLSACKELRLPLCDQETIKRIHRDLSNGATPDLGIEVLIGAWLMHEQSNEAGYAQWEAATVRDLLNYVTL